MKGCRRQPTVKGGLHPRGSCLRPEIEAALLSRAVQLKVSPSWIVAKILADAFGVKDQAHWANMEKVPKEKRKIIHRPNMRWHAGRIVMQPTHTST